jgi:uncharacterized protein (TIRG00374 family)
MILSGVRQVPRVGLYVAAIAFAAACAFSLRGDLARLSFEPVLRSWNLVFAAALLSLINYALRIGRWRLYLARLGHPLEWSFAALTFSAGFAYTLSPGKIGEMVRARYYVSRGVPLVDVAAAFFAERLMDLMAAVLLATVLFTTFPRYRGVMSAAAVAVTVVLCLLALLPWSRFARTVRSTTRGSQRLRSALTALTASLASTRSLLCPAALAMAFTVGLLAWCLVGIGFGFLSSMFPQAHLGAVAAIGICNIAELAGALSFLPGGLGSAEAVMVTLLAGYGYSASQALLLTLTYRLVTLWLAVALGWVAVFALRKTSPIAASPSP